MVTRFKITNVTCGACVKLSKAALSDLPGVNKIEIDDNGLAAIESTGDISWEAVAKALADVNKNAILL